MRPATILAHALAVVVLLVAAACRAEPALHGPTGIAFPDELAGFTRTGFHDYEAERPGLGVSYAYRTPQGINATVYLYTAGLKAVPTDLNHPAFAQLRAQTVREIAAFAEGRGEAVRQVARDTLKVATPRGDVPVFYDAFVISGQAGGRDTYALLWPARRHFMKIRITRNPGQDIDAQQLREFYDAVVRLGVESR